MKAHRAEDHRLAFWCPGCAAAHHVRIAPHPAAWGWNGSFEEPTLTPSVLVTCNAPGEVAVCHSHVTSGRIAFLPDSTHALAGQTVDLPAWPGR